MTEWEAALRRLAARCNQPPVESERHKKKRLYVRKGVKMRPGPKGLFTVEQIREIRALRKSGLTLREVGERFNVTASYVYSVTGGKSHRWLK